jgi:hypothetical protein
MELPNIHDVIVSQGVDGALRRLYDYLKELDQRLKEQEGRAPFPTEPERKPEGVPAELLGPSGEPIGERPRAEERKNG